MAPSDAKVLILTPMKSAQRHLDGYFAGLDRLTYPRRQLSLGILESDSTDDTFADDGTTRKDRQLPPDDLGQEGFQISDPR